MCGRYTLTADREALVGRFGLTRLPGDLPRRYNIAPSQEALVIVPERDGPAGVLMRWGLVPAWAGRKAGSGAGRGVGNGTAGPRTGAGLINARAETVAGKPAFRDALRHRRCLVPADGFFEWRRDGRRRVPFHFRLRSGAPFAFAGLWEPGPDGAPGFAILTTAANDLVRPLHDRMAAILPPDAEAVWLDPALTNPAALLPLLGPAAAEAMEAHEVSALVNSPRHDGPASVQPVQPFLTTFHPSR